MSMKTLIEIKNLTKRYGEKLILDDISLSVKSGEIIALLGENGAGKSTMINLINQLAFPSSGSIKLSLSMKKVAVMLQNNLSLERVTVKEAIQLACSYYAKPLDYEEVLQLADLAEQEKSFMTKLSGGQKRRLSFALSLAGNPDLIFLDEPTTGMDAERREEFWQEVVKLQAAGKTLFITSHYLEELENIASRLILLNQHKIAFDGTLAELRSQNANTEISFNFDRELPILSEAMTLKQTGNYYSLTSNDGNALIKELVPLFDQGLSNLTVQQNSLDSLFKGLIEKNS